MDLEKAKQPTKAVSPVAEPRRASGTGEGRTDSQIARKHDSKQAIMLSRYPDSVIETIRKAVKLVGKDAFFGRFTPEEKRMLADIAYSYKRRGMRTSENEISRIAVNFIVADYQENGENSILERVLKALNG